MSKKLFGFDLLRKQVIDEIESELEFANDWHKGESQIESLFFAALHCRFRFQPTEFSELLLIDRVPLENREGFFERSQRALIVESQVQIDQWRVDFVVYAYTPGALWRASKIEQGEPRWRKLIVECDGHDFHERTKEQAAKDRSRDRALSLKGYEIFRFTGSELWRDPLGCADQIYNWAIMGI